MLIPLSLGQTLANHADNLSALTGWDDITMPLLEKLHTPQTATEALVALQQLQRLSPIAELGFYKYSKLHEIFQQNVLPTWRDFAALPTSDAQKQRLGDLLYEGDPLKRTPLIVNLCDFGRGIGERIVERCKADNLDIEVTFDDPWFHRALLQVLSKEHTEAYALWRAGRIGEVDRRIGMRVTHTSIPYPEASESFKEKNRLYNETVSGLRRKREQNPFFTITVLPTPQDAVMDNLSYAEYVDLFFRMCDVDWKEVDKAHRVLIDHLNNGKHLRFTNSDGTDLEMDITGFTFANSLVAKNVPGSEVFSAPHKTSVNGRIVAKGRFLPKDQNELIEDITLNFKDGRVVSFSAVHGEQHLAESVNEDEGSCFVGEIGIGTNPVLQRHVVNSLMVEKIGGSFHIALGNAYTFTDYLGVPVHVDNGNRSKIHWDITTMLVGKEGRILLDGVAIMEHGKFLDSRLHILNAAQ